jgi:hypothetical protein
MAEEKVIPFGYTQEIATSSMLELDCDSHKSQQGPKQILQHSLCHGAKAHHSKGKQFSPTDAYTLVQMYKYNSLSNSCQG